MQKFQVEVWGGGEGGGGGGGGGVSLRMANFSQIMAK